jgi:hypothetical protein
MKIRTLSAGAALLATLALPLQAQVSAGGLPPSWGQVALAAPPTLLLPAPPPSEMLLAEDAAASKDEPLRFGWPMELSVGMVDAGRWEVMPNGDRLWRLRIHSPGARSLNFVFERWQLPPGAEFFVYGDDRSLSLGAFTEFNNKPDGSFAVQPLPGDAATLEYREPAAAAYAGEIVLRRAIHGYRDIFALASRNYGDSGSCNVNVMCPQGDPWADPIRSVAMILTSGGSRICSGALVNNLRQDGTQYFLTANHCLGGETSWIFMFNYQSPGCPNVNGPTTNTVQGAIRRASNSASDFALLELTEAIPESYGVYYAGWSAVDEAAPEVTAIHHPSGDIKKISFELDPVVSDRYLGNQGIAGSHWKVTQWDEGTTEPGSSGSPIFDPQQRIIGQLHGGYASCSSLTPDWYGKVSMSWDYGSTPATRLVDWLDPDGIGQLQLDGFDPANSVGLALELVELLADSDGDGVAEPGEALELGLWLSVLSPPAGPLTGVLSSGVPWLAVTQDEAGWTGFLPGDPLLGEPAFALQLDPEAPAIAQAPLELNLSDGLGFAQTLSFALPVGERVLHWSADFEDGAPGWNHQAAEGWADAWHLSSADHQSPLHAWKCGDSAAGDYPNLLDARLQSPPLNLPAYAELCFRHRMQAEVSGAFPDSAYDGGVLELSPDGGLSWLELLPAAGGYNKAFRGTAGGGNPASHPFAAGRRCWSGEFGWQTSRVDLAEWAGQMVRLRFRFGSDAGGGAEGWFIDDLRLEGLAVGGELPPVTDLAVALSGGQLVLSWTAVPGASAYRVEQAAALGEAWLPVAMVEQPGWQVPAAPGMALLRVVALSR